MDILRQSSSTREDLGLLAVMEALEEREKVTQREIARQTGLNLKKVNYCLHRLLEKGHVKFQRVRQNPDKRAYLYILTPSGVRAKSQLTYRFVKLTLDFYGRMESKLRDCFSDMHRAGVRRVLLFGASDVVKVMISMADGEGPEICGLVDDSLEVDEYQGLGVVSSDSVSKLAWDGVLVTELDGSEETEERLQRLGISGDRIWRLS